MLDDDEFRVSEDRRHAVLRVDDLPVIDTFVFLGPNDAAASMSFKVEWDASGPRTEVGAGDDVPPTDPAAFRGRFRRARAEARFSGSEIGFSFRTRGKATSERGFAQLGEERNGVFL
jgi:hypothetical protein